MQEFFIGIDPGKSGGYAIIKSNGDHAVWPWDGAAFATDMSRLCQEGPVTAAVEKVSAMPKQGVTSMFNFGKSAGFIEGVLTAFGIPYQLVPPQKWKKEYSLGSDKNQSICVCERLFPSVSLYRTERCTTKHDGMAEALLIAEFARRHMSRCGGPEGNPQREN